MTDALLAAVAGGVAAAAALLLAGLRFRWMRRRAVRGALLWMRASNPSAIAVLASLSAAAFSGLSIEFAQEPTRVLAVQLDSFEPPDGAALLAAAPGAPLQIAEARPTGGAPAAESEAASKEKAFASLRDFASRMESKRVMIASLGGDSPQTPSAGALADVDTMMQRLRARLDANPDDLKGWMTLGWAYANTGQYQLSVNAYETALKLDSGNAEIKLALEEAKTKTAAIAKTGE